MEPPYEFVDFQKLLNHIESLPQINPSEKDEDLISWLKEFPTIMNKLQSTISIQEIWSKYLLLINSNIENYCWILNQTTSLVTGVLEIAEADLPKLVITPNYLQAPQATDYVSIEDKIYIIKSRPDQESIIHEILHHCLDIRLEACKDLIKKNISLLKPILDQMIEYQYAWAYDEDSWNRVFEENLMRAASAWLNFHEDINSSRKDAQLYKDYGFIYVPVILEQFIFNWKGLDNFRGFIKDCLEACNR